MYIPNLDPYSFTGTAVILGYLLTNDFTTSEQAALGAWFNVVGDILASNSSWSAVLLKNCKIKRSLMINQNNLSKVI